MTLDEDCTKAVEKALGIPGLISREDMEFLYKLACCKGNIVELGCYLGRSTAVLLQAAAVSKAQLTSIDIFNPFEVTPQGSAEAWSENLVGLGLEPPSLLQMSTDEAATVYGDEISFLFIDADHGKAAVAQDLTNWTPKVKVGGIVALHDMWLHHRTGVAQATVEWWRRQGGNWRFMEQRGLTIAFRRAA